MASCRSQQLIKAFFGHEPLHNFVGIPSAWLPSEFSPINKKIAHRPAFTLDEFWPPSPLLNSTQNTIPEWHQCCMSPVVASMIETPSVDFGARPATSAVRPRKGGPVRAARARAGSAAVRHGVLNRIIDNATMSRPPQ